MMPPKVMATDTDIEMDCATDAVVVSDQPSSGSGSLRIAATTLTIIFLCAGLARSHIDQIASSLVGSTMRSWPGFPLKGFGKGFQTILGVGYASPLSD